MLIQKSKLLLDAGGEISDWSDASFGSYQALSGDTAPSDIPAQATNAEVVLVEFASSADGRGFSLPAAFRAQKFAGKLIATGSLIPDQVSMAFQCGFKAVLIDSDQVRDYGLQAWEAALKPAVSLSYAPTRSPAIQSIWRHRAC